MKNKISELFFQIIPVMIGVYLGFVVSNWSAANQKQHQAKIFIDNLLSEIETNEKRIQQVIDYHVMLRDSSRHYADEQNEIRKPAFFEGTRILKLTSSAYNTGIQTGIVNEMPLDKIQAVNQLYTFQHDYNEFGNLLMASLINKEFSNKEEDIRGIARLLSVTMTDIVIKENDLMEAYHFVKNKLQE